MTIQRHYFLGRSGRGDSGRWVGSGGGGEVGVDVNGEVKLL